MNREVQTFLYSKPVRYSVFAITAIAFAIFNSENFFFWDTISQISVPSNYYFFNNFQNFFLPDTLATGHPTFVGMYVALVWKLFGRSLLVSHLSMIPFIFGILFQLYRYIESADTSRLNHLLIFIIVLFDATLVSQLSMVTFDIVQIFFFLWSVNSIIFKRRLALVFAFAGLGLTSLRGTLCSFGLILFHLYNEYHVTNKFTFKSLIPFIPGLITLFLFLGSFYATKGWIIHNVVSNRWKSSGELASMSEMLRNAGLIVWRLFDYGRFGLWIVFGFIIFKNIMNNKLKDIFFLKTFDIALFQFLIFAPVLVVYKNFIGHRYLLTVIIPVAICSGYWILKYSRFPKILFAVVAGIVVSGYFWIYPDRIAQGWDATPAHWSFYKVRKEMLSYLSEKSIPVDRVGSYFPNIASFKYIDLSPEDLSFSEANIGSDDYILFSNVFNVPDEIQDDLLIHEKWNCLHKIKKRGVYMILYQRRKDK